MTEKTFNKLLVLSGSNSIWIINNRHLFPGLHYSYLNNSYYYVQGVHTSSYHAHAVDAIWVAVRKGWLKHDR